MKQFLIALATVFALTMVLDGFAPTAMAQTSKKQQKALTKKWRDKAKQYKKNPLSLMQREEGYQQQLKYLNDRIAALQKDKGDLMSEIDKLEAKLRGCNASMDSMKSEFKKLQMMYETAMQREEEDVDAGLLFRVQIGAYEKIDVTKYMNAADDNFKGETQDMLNKFLVGKFRELPLAELFQQDIKKLGIKDAWIVPYLDGIRITITEAKQMIGAGTTPGTRNINNPPSNFGTPTDY
jgi:hypothetical protein